MKVAENNSLSSTVTTAHNTSLKSNAPVYCMFNGDRKEVNYSKSDNVFLQILKKILSFFNKMISKDKSFSYSDNKKITVMLTPSNDIAHKVENKLYAYDEEWYFSHIDPTSGNTDTSLKILSEENYNKMMADFKKGFNFLNDLYDQHNMLIDTLKDHFDIKNNAMTLKDVPKDVLQHFEKTEIINQMFMKHIQILKEMDLHHGLNLTNYNEYDKTLPSLASGSLLKASSSDDKTMTLGLAASKNMNYTLINNIKEPEYQFYLGIDDPHSDTKTDTIKLLSWDDFSSLVGRVDKGMQLLKNLYDQHFDINGYLAPHLRHKDGQFLLKNVDLKYLNRLQKLDMLTKVFLDFIDTVTKFNDETNAHIQSDMAKKNDA